MNKWGTIVVLLILALLIISLVVEKDDNTNTCRDVGYDGWTVLEDDVDYCYSGDGDQRVLVPMRDLD